ncbi:MAG: Holliday junction resolvase RuvX [Lachnospiraceae bacterium]|nr:Holliday junction resolvase RuvX [Lachnospiraceae bacterium]MCI8780675.1 Holliday junction resolvase RuvX [Lachnospiraceae bacterium]
MRIMGLDYGAKTVGVAISDELLLTAQPVETIKRDRETKLRKTLARIEELLEEYDVEKVVVGLPKKLNNEEGERCGKTREFAQMVHQRSGLEVIFWDERLTTVLADAALAEGNVARENRKEYIDKVAASLILKSYLESIAEK